MGPSTGSWPVGLKPSPPGRGTSGTIKATVSQAEAESPTLWN